MLRRRVFRLECKQIFHATSYRRNLLDVPSRAGLARRQFWRGQAATFCGRHEQPSAAMPLKLGQFSNDERNARESRSGDDAAKPSVLVPNTTDSHDPNTTARESSKGGRRFQ